MPRIPKNAINVLAGLVLLVNPSFLFSQKIPVAVLDFEATGISQTEAITLTDRLRNELFRLGDFKVVERGLMEGILLEQDFQMSGCTTNECLVEVGRLTGAKLMVGGRISKIGALFTVSARVVDVETGELLRVSDYDLQGSLEEMLTRGMGQVAAMLSMNNLESQRPLYAKPTDMLSEQRKTAEPAIDRTSPTSPIRSADIKRPRYQISTGFPSTDVGGYFIEISYLSRGKESAKRFALLPAFAVGHAQMIWDFPNQDIPVDEVYDTNYFMPIIKGKIQTGGLGFAAKLGYGFEFGKMTDRLEQLDTHNYVSTVVLIGGELSVRLGAINLLFGLNLYSSSAFGTRTESTSIGISF